MNIKNIRWGRVLIDGFKTFLPIPILLIALGITIIEIITTFGDADRMGFVSTQTTTNTLLVFIGLNIGITFVLAGIIYQKLNMMSELKKDDSLLFQG